MNKENEYSEKPDVKVKVESEAQDLFNAHDFDITIDLGKNILLVFQSRKRLQSQMSVRPSVRLS